MRGHRQVPGRGAQQRVSPSRPLDHSDDARSPSRPPPQRRRERHQAGSDGSIVERTHPARETDSDSDDEEDFEENLFERWHSIGPVERMLPGDHKIDRAQEETQGFRSAMVICPSLGQTWRNLAGWT